MSRHRAIQKYLLFLPCKQLHKGKNVVQHLLASICTAPYFVIFELKWVVKSLTIRVNSHISVMWQPSLCLYLCSLWSLFHGCSHSSVLMIFARVVPYCLEYHKMNFTVYIYYVHIALILDKENGTTNRRHPMWNRGAEEGEFITLYKVVSQIKTS